MGQKSFHSTALEQHMDDFKSCLLCSDSIYYQLSCKVHFLPADNIKLVMAVSLSILTAIFPGEPGLAGFY